MKNLFIFCFICLFFELSAQTGKVSDNLSLPSKVLNMERKYAIYLPADYETSSNSLSIDNQLFTNSE